MMNTYLSLDEVAVDYLSSMQDADNGLFAAGDKLVAAHDQGYGLRAIWEACGGARVVSRATVNNHMRTAMIFPPDKRAENVTFNIHMTCARQAKMRDPETWATAHEWLDKVVELDMGKAQLDEAIRAAKGNPKAGEPVYLLRNVEATLVYTNTIPPFGNESFFSLALNNPLSDEFKQAVTAHRLVMVTVLLPAAEVQQLDAHEDAA